MDGTRIPRPECAELNDPRPLVRPRLTLVVPTRNERESVPLLLRALEPAFGELPVEILFVDDSDDDTPATAARHAPDCRLPVRMIHREGGAREGGLAGAVLAGARQARGEWALVMDADLQHPPEAAAALARTALGHDVDIVVGTRYAGSGSTGDGLDGPVRRFVSRGSTLLTKATFPHRLAGVSDPMSGLFAFRTAAIDMDRLSPLGFKVLLELLVRHPGARVAEVAYRFAPRAAGTSKASLREGLRFLRHLARLRRPAPAAHRADGGPHSSTGRRDLGTTARFLAFGLVGLSGIAVNTAALWFFHSVVGLQHLLGATLATQVSSLWNFALLETLVYRGGRGGDKRAVLVRGIAFLALNNLLLLGRLPLLQWLVDSGIGLLTANVLSLVALFVARFLFSDLLIYRGRRDDGARRDPVRVLVAPGSVPPGTTAPAPAGSTASSPATASAPAGPAAAPGRHPKRPRYLTYRYDIAGTVTIGSQIRLPELEFFRAQWVPPDACDITVRVGDVGRRLPRHRAVMTEIPGRGGRQPTTVQYEEQLGRLGANFRVDIGDPIDVLVSPLLARSPHVVYTNVLEALLRFVLVARGRMLLHSATVELGGTGVMLSALTDTGKTSTVLRLLSEHGGRFLSDDMTVVDATGNALCFPKPLTISAHTLHAVRSDDLTPHEWRRLQRQSRLHSKEGRSFAFTLARHNLPIMGVNAVTQILVPPPKYAVDRLVACRLSSAVKVTELFVIERGAPRLSELGHDETVERLLVNTEDAYGFPPFRYFAPAITVDGLDHARLRSRERDVLSGFLSGVRTRVLASDRFGWADEIPRLLDADRPVVNGRPAPLVDGHPWPHWMPEAPEGEPPLPVRSGALPPHPALRTDSGTSHESESGGRTP
ncbi:glycosyltransferase involved in cell wall biosynthesis [Streptomyces sp. PanSC19]|uniref:glycosyltransferase n=1 Tax=Streptomyces sp. PanSC19 TaxID=1520455 RepID=UPI000FA7C996|nr:glycosyltransferase family 2 protein [Streptomyces sp. PanSC19]ROQ27044.1 glycosyltransferase involved in cell wall biosynthesis [Streptomyces sp. PanSC19]